MSTKYSAVCPPGTYISGVVLDIFQPEISSFRGRISQPPSIILGVVSIICKRYPNDASAAPIIVPVPGYSATGTRTQPVAPDDSNLNLVASDNYNYVFRPIGISSPLTILAGVTGNVTSVGVSSGMPNISDVGIGITFETPLLNVQILTAGLAKLQADAIATAPKYTALCPPGMYICGLTLDMFDSSSYPQSVGGVLSVLCKSYVSGNMQSVYTGYRPRGINTLYVGSDPTGPNQSLVLAPKVRTSPWVRDTRTSADGVVNTFIYVFKPLMSDTPLTILSAPPSSASISVILPSADNAVGTGIEFTVLDPRLPMISINVLTVSLNKLIADAFGVCKATPSAICDAKIRAYCKQSDTQNDPLCGCVNSPSTNPTCNDVRCTAAAAYRPTGSTSVCPSAPITCAEWALLGNGKHLDPRVTPPAGSCGAPVSALPITNTVMIIVMIIIVVILGAISTTRRNYVRQHTARAALHTVAHGGTQ